MPRFKDELDIMKFICRDFWSALYQKQVDNLRTNHQVLVVSNALVRILSSITSETPVCTTSSYGSNVVVVNIK